MFDVRYFLLFLLATGLFGQAQSDLDTQRLYKISQREQRIYQQLETNPDFYTAEDLERKFSEITLAYSNYLSENPDDVEALILYGKLLRQLGENDRAFQVFLKADELDPERARAGPRRWPGSQSIPHTLRCLEAVACIRHEFSRLLEAKHIEGWYALCPSFR